MSRIVRTLGTALMLVAGIAAPAMGQVTGSIGPLVGYYRPFGHFDPASVYSTSLPQEPSDLSGVAWGAEGQLSFGGRLGLEGQLASASSTIPEVITPGGPSGPTNARVTIATLQARYDASPSREKAGVWLSAGPALIEHGGDAYRRYGSPRSVGVAAGIGIAVPITSTLRVVAGVTALRYSFDVPMPAELRYNPGSMEHGTQTDAIFHLGLRWGGS